MPTTLTYDEVHALSDAELLRVAIRASGLSLNQFAYSSLVRDPRTVRRWLSPPDPGEPEPTMPQAVRKWLETFLMKPPEPVK